MRMQKKGMAGKIIASVVAAVVGFLVISALLPTFLSSISTLNMTISGAGTKIPGGSSLASLLYLLPFLLVVGAIVAAAYYFMGKKGWG